MKNLNVQFNIDEKLPAELEGKTLGEVFDLVRIRQKELIKLLEKNPNNIEKLSLDDQMYLRIAMMFHNMANGDMSSVKGIASPWGMLK